MATYIILNTVFIALALMALKFRVKYINKALVCTFVVIALLTLIFDNLIIYSSIVGYDSSKILGLKLGLAPIEDFMYALLAVLLVPLLWRKLGAKNE